MTSISQKQKKKNKKEELIIFNAKKEKSVQDWISVDEILEDGVFKINSEYLKLIKIHPINYHLKSELEKEAILSAYRLFLKTCNFDLQIVIQSKKENLLGHITNIEKKIQLEKNEIIKHMAEEYIEFIQKMNSERNSLSKTFFIIVKEPSNVNQDKEIAENSIKNNLKEKYLKIKECLARCGNYVEEIITKEEVKNIMNSFFYVKNYLYRVQKR